MKQILKRMKKPLTAWLGAKPLLICSTALALTNCAGLRKFPEERLWEFDAKSDVCAEYKIVDYDNIQYVWLRDVPRAQCPSIFGFKSSRIPAVLDWQQDATAWGKKHCK